MAAFRRTFSVATAGRYRVGALGSTVQHVRPIPMATLSKSLPAASSPAKLGLGILGLQGQTRAYGSMPIWMSTHQKVALNPEQAFLQLSHHDQEMLVLAYLLMSEETMKVCRFHAEGLESVLSQFAVLYDKQEQFEQGLWALVIVAGSGVISMACFLKGAKDQSELLVKNLVSNSGDIVAALVGAFKHGIGSKFLGRGEQFEPKSDWWSKEKVKAVKNKDEEEKVRVFKYPSSFFTWGKDMVKQVKPGDKTKLDDKSKPDEKGKPNK